MNAHPSQIQIFHDQEAEERIYLKDFRAVLRRRWWLILLGFAIVVGLTAVYVIVAPKRYAATAVVNIPVQSGGSGLASALGAFLPIGPSSSVVTEIEIIKGRSIAEKVIEKLELDKKEENLGLDWRQMVLRFQENLKVRQIGASDLIGVTATGSSPREAKDIADQAAIEYIRLSEASSLKLWKDMITQMEGKLTQTRSDLERSRKLLYNSEAEEGIPTAFGPILAGDGTSKYGIPYVVPQAVAELKASIMQMEVQLEALMESFSEEDPQVINLKNRIAASKRKYQQEERQAIEKYNKQFGLTELAAEVIFNQQLYASLLTKQEELKAQHVMQNRSPEIVEEAMEPLFPSKPRKKLILMASGVLGLFIGLGLALFREYTDSSMHTVEDVKRSVDVPVLGAIPRLSKKSMDKSALINDVNPSRDERVRELYRESYRMLLLELMAAVNGKLEHNNVSIQHQGGLVLVVASSKPGEGKSIVAANLAMSIAQTGREVLLVDADYHSFVCHDLLNLDARVGLMSILTGNAVWHDTINNTTSDNLHVIASGDKNGLSDPSVLFISPHLEEFVEASRRQFDAVIFNSPTAASSAAAIGSKVDGVLLVIKANDTQRDLVLQTKQRIQNSGGRILGAVLNCL